MFSFFLDYDFYFSIISVSYKIQGKTRLVPLSHYAIMIGDNSVPDTGGIPLVHYYTQWHVV